MPTPPSVSSRWFVIEITAALMRPRHSAVQRSYITQLYVAYLLSRRQFLALIHSSIHSSLLDALSDETSSLPSCCDVTVRVQHTDVKTETRAKRNSKSSKRQRPLQDVIESMHSLSDRRRCLEAVGRLLTICSTVTSHPTTTSRALIVNVTKPIE